MSTAALLALLLATGPAPDPVVDSIGMELVRVPAGTFRMGSPAGEPGRQPNEAPLREVTISRPLLVGVHEVTVGQFRRFVEATGYVTDAERDAGGGFGIDFMTGRVEQDPDCDWRSPGFPGHLQTDEHPVILVSWQDAEAFCRWLSAREGATYRLPTEAEWEYACRAGTSDAWWTGNDPASLEGAANTADRSLAGVMPVSGPTARYDDGHAFTAPVGSFRANPWGLHDMHGNAWEWCADWYDAEPRAVGPAVDPPGPAVGDFRSIRGGGWLNGPWRNRAAQRIYFAPSFRYCLLSGFRVVRELPAGAD